MFSIALAGCVEESKEVTVNPSNDATNVMKIDNIKQANTNSNNNMAKDTSVAENTKNVNKEATLKITSNPSGAKVLINNEYKGVTPLNLTLKEGTYNVKILKDDYEEYTTSITIKAGETKTITAKLKEIPKTGTLIINSNPSEAEVYINESYRGCTPLKLTLDSGTYKVKVIKDGYYRYAKIITLIPGKSISIYANLKEPIGTYENPAEVGDVVRVKDGLGRIYEVAVLDYIKGDKANSLIENANPLNPKPMKGYEYLLVKVWVKYVSGEKSDYISSYDFKAYSIMDKKYDEHDPAMVVLPDNLTELDGLNVIPGGEMEGWIPFEVRKNAEILIAFNGIPPGDLYSLEEPLCFIKIG